MARVVARVRSVELVARGADGRLGTCTRNTWRSVLPYDLSFEAVLVRYQPPSVLDVTASGEQVGRGRWELSPERDGTRVVYTWEVATIKPWMNWFAPLLRPLFAWNHDVVMRWGGEGLAQRLGTRLEA